MLDFVVGDGVLGVPNVVRYEFLNLIFPRNFQIVVIDGLDLCHKTLNVLDQDIVSGDQHALLGA